MTAPAAGQVSSLIERRNLDYLDFLKAKVSFDQTHGFPVAAGDVSAILKPHQAEIVRWAVQGGKRAIFASFGLGKTICQLEALRLILAHEGGRALIVCPLGVRDEFRRDAINLLGIDPPRFVRRSGDVGGPGMYITNYESVRAGILDTAMFDAVSLDEGACLRNYGTVTSQMFSTAFAHCRFRFVATATPSPNEYRELFEYAHFLGILDRGQAMTRFTKRDSTKANNLTLLDNMADEFWHWVASWAVFLTNPAQICPQHRAGLAITTCDCDAYTLPSVEVIWHEVATAPGVYASPDRDGQGRLLADSSLGVVDAAATKRLTLDERKGTLAEIIEGYRAEDDLDQLVVWVELNAEQAAVERLCAEWGITYSSVHGALDIDEAERRLREWRDGLTCVLIAKPVMLGEGVNLQRCNKAVFLGVSFKFADTFQALHRIVRFGQSRTCDVHFIYAEAERSVVGVLRRKWALHNDTEARMAEIIAEHGLSGASLTEALTRSIGVERIEASGDLWLMACNDTVAEAQLIDDGSIGLIVTSMPFGTLYEYSTAVEDLGHNDTPEQFWAQMDYLSPHLRRILSPGRILAVHVKDRVVFGNMTGAGYSTIYPFHAEAIMHYRRHGFDFLGQITVTTDVVRENAQSYRLGWTEMCKDGTKMGCGTSEYILLFRSPQSDRTRGYADDPVIHAKARYSRSRWQTDAHAFWRSSGNRLLTPEDMDGLSSGERAKLFASWTAANVYDYETHVRIGEHIDAKGQLPATFMLLAPASVDPDAVWTEAEIVRMRTLNTEQARRRLIQHVCPMALTLVDRLIERFSNPGDLVYDPFAGIGTVPRQAILADRRGRGVELNADYFYDAVRYCQAAAANVDTPTLFDLEPGPVIEDIAGTL